ncbi:FAD-dependent thymidylate synthase [uncultured Tyzzerella sp.]|uniref:FAD-dependent thymidylate synthase n=1 Tax=uncultured Tyzzerella sp. TaxID=2321398 RepID=UPI002941ED82|nr:FAD-dependent thymidylate synthase [uncultured Tyzzerella sp.]
MNIIKPSYVIEQELNEGEMLKAIERAGRTCYKSENLVSEESAKKFVTNILKLGHESVIEHEKITVRIICDRGVTHEIVRHRIASYSQESTRYCNYCNDRFGNELTFIEPCFFSSDSEQDIKNKQIWLDTMATIEKNYNMLIENGAKPEEARAILPNSLKTEIVVTMNLRAWRHFFKLRADKSAHPQIREISTMILNEFKEKLPVIFGDL